MYLGTLIKSLLTLFLLVLSGYFVKKLNIVSEKTVEELSDVLLKVILPLSIIASVFAMFSSLSFLLLSSED